MAMGTSFSLLLVQPFYGEHVGYSTDPCPVLSQEATESVYSSRVSLGVVMPTPGKEF